MDLRALPRGRRPTVLTVVAEDPRRAPRGAEHHRGEQVDAAREIIDQEAGNIVCAKANTDLLVELPQRRRGRALAIITAPVIFFFQAEDGIRAHCVTGVQTCALPI